MYNAEKGSFNDNYDLSIRDIPIELYIEDVNDGNATNGRYSILKQEWIKEPEPINYDIPDISEELSHYEEKCNEMLQEQNSEVVLDFINEIYMMRKLGLAEDGEASIGNLVFKELRNEDMINKLKDHYYDLRSKQLSESKQLDESSLSRLYQHTKNKDTFAIIGSQDKDTKQSRFPELKSLVGNLRDKVPNIGYNYLEGTYTYEDGEQGIEDSLIVYNIPKNDALDIANKLNQESIIWKDDNYFGFLNTEGNEEGTFEKGDMTFDQQITNMYGSRLRSGNKFRPAFAFECKLIETDSKGSTFSKQHKSNIIKYPVCSWKLIESSEDSNTLFGNLAKLLKSKNTLDAIDSPDVTEYIVSNDLLTLNIPVREDLADERFEATYDIYQGSNYIGSVGYKNNSWICVEAILETN